MTNYNLKISIILVNQLEQPEWLGKTPHHQGSYQDAASMPTCGMPSLFPVEMLLAPHQEPNRKIKQKVTNQNILVH